MFSKKKKLLIFLFLFKILSLKNSEDSILYLCNIASIVLKWIQKLSTNRMHDILKKHTMKKWKDLWNVISHKIFEFKKKLNLWTFIFKLNADALNP